MTEHSASPASPGWVDISTPDPARAKAFYEGLFGWKVNNLDENYALVSADDGPPTAGMGTASPESPYTGIVAYFPVDDVDAALERAEKLGGTKVMGPQSTGDGRIAAFTDPDGNTVGVMGP
ncbi:VOC family protein [Nocardiopsis algeriensis]|uniref:VOC family protein n=1 Tax=Nocardiopsis algeriensis TaxID=1478215 RepID=UPI003B431A64